MVALLVGCLTIGASAADTETVTVSNIFGTTGALSGKSISWTSGGVTVTNNQASSTTAIRTSDSDHYRVYAKSELVITAPETIQEIVITATSSSYANVLKTSAEGSSCTATVSGSVVTITGVNAETVTISITAQTRINKVVVTYDKPGDAGCVHQYTPATCEDPATCSLCGATDGEALGHDFTKNPVVTDPTCTEGGYTLTQCSRCEETEKSNEIDALGHSDENGDSLCDTCGEKISALVTALNSGDKVVLVCSSKSMVFSGFVGTNTYGSGIAYVGDPNVEGAAVLTVGKEADGKYTFKLEDGRYLALTSSANALHTNTTVNNNSKWTVTIDADGNATIQNAAYTRYIKWNASSPRFACYTSGQTAVQFYKVGGDCEHTWGNDVVTEPTCTDGGYTTQTCSKCGATQVINVTDPNGHNYNSVVTEPNCTDGGYTTKTCSGCGDVQITDETEKLGHIDENEDGICDRCDFVISSIPKYNVNFVVPYGVASTNVSGKYSSVTLESPANLTLAGVTYEFAGWSTSSVDDTATEPTLYIGEVSVTADVTYYAVYTYEKSSGAEAFQKVTSTDSIVSGGAYLIVYEDGSLAFNGSLATLDAVGNGTAVTINDGTISSSADLKASVFYIVEIDGGYSVQSASGKYIGNSSDSNALSTSDSALKNTISFNDDGTVNIIGAGGSYLRFNAASNQNRFRYYKSGSYTGQKAIALYVLSGGSETRYTSLNARFEGATVNLGDDLDIKYQASANATFARENLAIRFTMNGESVVVAVNESYYAWFRNIAPQFIAANIKAELLYKGDVIAVHDGYSVKQNALNTVTASQAKLDKGETTEAKHNALVAAVEALIAYGEAANKFVNEEEVSEFGEMVETEDVRIIGASSDENKSVTELKVHFDNVNKLVVTFKADTIEGVTVKIGGASFSDFTNNGDGTYSVRSNGILATKFGEDLIITLCVNGEAVQTVNYNVYAYCQNMSVNASTTYMKNLAIALNNYGAAAVAYQASK